MLKIVDITFKDISGIEYEFESYLIGTTFADVGAIYIFAKLERSGEGFVQMPLYIGKTQSLALRFYDPHKIDYITRQGGMLSASIGRIMLLCVAVKKVVLLLRTTLFVMVKIDLPR